MKKSSNELQRSQPPAPTALREFHFPHFEHYRVGGGIRVYEAQCPDVGLTTVEFLTPGGGLFTPPDKAGLAAFTAAMVDEGTQTLDAQAIARSAERYGGYISSGCDWDSSAAFMAVLTAHLPETLEVFAQVLADAAFPEQEIERLRQQRIAERARRKADPASLAAEAFAAALYQEHHPYAAPLLGRASDLERLERSELFDFYKQTFWARNCAVIAVGDHDSELLRKWLESTFGGFATTEPPARAAREPSRVSGTRVFIVDRPEAQQTELRLGHIGPPRNQDGRAARIVMNSLLGGKFTSRINLNLREKNGFTYGASSRFVDRLGPGPFLVATAVENDVVGAAVQETIGELERIRQDLVTVEELDDTKRYIQGVFPYTMQTIQGLSSRLEELAVHELPLDYYDTMPERVDAVGRDEVLQAARDFLHPEDLQIVAVGPAARLEQELVGLGPSQTVTIEA